MRETELSRGGTETFRRLDRSKGGGLESEEVAGGELDVLPEADIEDVLSCGSVLLTCAPIAAKQSRLAVRARFMAIPDHHCHPGLPEAQPDGLSSP